MAGAKAAARVLDGLRSGHLRWPILLLLFLSTVLNYLDRQVLSVLAPSLKESLGLSEFDYGKILVWFEIGTVAGLLLVGPLMDRFGIRWGFPIAIILWSIGGAFTAVAAGFVGLAVCRAILGFGEAGNWPACSKAVAEWFPKKERALAMGFFNGGVSIGAIIAVPLVGLVVYLTSSWQLTFVITATLSIPWLIFWLWLYHPSHKHPRISKEELDLINSDRIAGGGKKVYGVLGKGAFWGIFGARFVISPIWFLISFWLFMYLSKQFGFNLKQMAAVAWIPFATADVGNIAGGYASGKLIAAGMTPVKARKVMMTVGAAGLMVSVAVAFANTWWLALLMISFLTFAWGIWVSNMLGLVADSFPSSEVGTVMSWSGLGQYGGAAIFTWFTGWAVAFFPKIDFAFISLDKGYKPVFLVAALLPILGHMFTLLLNHEPAKVAVVAGGPAAVGAGASGDKLK